VGDEHSETAIVPFESVDASKLDEGKLDFKKLGFPNRISFEIYLQQLFHEHVFIKAKNRLSSLGKPQLSSQPVKDGLNLLGHFCVSLAHRIFSNKVLAELESLV